MTLRTALALVALTATSAAAQRVTFPSFTGPSAASVRNQIVGAVCDTSECVGATKTTTNGKPDWKKAKKESVQFFITGAVTQKGKALSLDVFVYNKAGAPRSRKSFPLDKSGTLAPKNLQAVMDLLTAAFGGKRRATPEPAKAPDEDRPPAKEPGKTSPARPPEPAPKRPENRPETRSLQTRSLQDEPSSAAERGPAEPSPDETRRKATFLVIDLGADVLNRRLEYTQVATANLRRYDLNVYGQLAVGVQFYPLALVRDDLLAGLGVEFGLALAPWLQSRLTSIPDAFPTSALRFDGALRFNIAPIKGFALTISPYVGVRTQSFTVGALPDGRRLDGLPNIGFVGLRAGLALDIPVIPKWLNIFGRFSIIPVFGSGEILSTAYFPTGSAVGLEGNGGLGIGLTSFLQLRVSFEFARYGVTFVTQPTDAYVAAGASDTYLGGNATLRLHF